MSSNDGKMTSKLKISQENIGVIYIQETLLTELRNIVCVCQFKYLIEPISINSEQFFVKQFLLFLFYFIFKFWIFFYTANSTTSSIKSTGTTNFNFHKTTTKDWKCQLYNRVNAVKLPSSGGISPDSWLPQRLLFLFGWLCNWERKTNTITQNRRARLWVNKHKRILSVMK